jgi:hypothetical protein
VTVKLPFASVSAPAAAFEGIGMRPMRCMSVIVAPATGTFVFASVMRPVNVAAFASLSVSAFSFDCTRIADSEPDCATTCCHFAGTCWMVKEPSSPLMPRGQLSTRIVAFAAGVVPSLPVTRPVRVVPAESVRESALADAVERKFSSSIAYAGWMTVMPRARFGSGASYLPCSSVFAMYSALP